MGPKLRVEQKLLKRKRIRRVRTIYHSMAKYPDYFVSNASPYAYLTGHGDMYGVLDDNNVLIASNNS